ncbi:MAG: hypothetical protein HYZ53_11160 [Planctomycetes bacterium]|nr:hypothetical protein [Planctomycetota bacterium]
MNRFPPGARRPGAEVRQRTGGFTLLEAVLAVFLLAGSIAASLQVLTCAQNTLESETVAAGLDAEGLRLVEQMMHELRQAGRSTLVPASPADSRSLSFLMNAGFDGSRIVWSRPTTYACALEDGEVENGRDDNGNGLIDEGVVVRTDGDRTPVVLGRFLETNGLAFSLEPDGGSLAISIRLARRTSKGELLRRTATVTVAFRN